MQITYTHRYTNENMTESVEGLTLRKCDGADYGSGQVEANADSCRQTAQLVAAILVKLAQRNALTPQDVVELVGMPDMLDPRLVG